MTFGERLRKLRDKWGYSGPGLGESVGVSKQTISHWETGRYEPSQEKLRQLATVLNVSIDYLLFGESASAQLGPESLEFARRFQALGPSEQVKWRQLIDMVGEPISNTKRSAYQQPKPNQSDVSPKHRTPRKQQKRKQQ